MIPTKDLATLEQRPRHKGLDAEEIALPFEVRLARPAGKCLLDSESDILVRMLPVRLDTGPNHVRFKLIDRARRPGVVPNRVMGPRPDLIEAAE